MPYRFAVLGARGYPSTYGGFETFVRRFAPYLVEQGDDVTVYCRGSRPALEMSEGVRCITTRGLETTSLSTLSFGLTSSLHARRSRYDAALVLNVANGFFLTLLRRAGVATALNVDGIEWERGKWNSVGKSVFRGGAAAASRFADELIVDSVAVGDIWEERFGRRGRFIPYGADVARPDDASAIRGLGLEPGGYLLVVARLVPENNVTLFLEALERLGPTTPAVVVGGGLPKNPIVGSLKAAIGRSDAFRWLGHVSDQVLLAQLWQHCGAYFHGHSVGGTNPALLQALGHGAPVVALDTPFNREVVRYDDQLVPAEPDIVAKQLWACLESPARRLDLAERGMETVRTRYMWNDVCLQYRELLVELANRRK